MESNKLQCSPCSIHRRSTTTGQQEFLCTFAAEQPTKVLTPDFDTCQRRVLQRRKGSTWYERWTWKGDHASPLEILLTEEGVIDQIFGLRFDKSYLVLELVLFYRIESCFAIIGYDCVSVGYKYEPPGYYKD